MRIAMIAALSVNRVIGIRNELPWNIPEDMKFFRETTMGKPIIMGRKTFESIGRPLDGRRNIVMTRDKTWKHKGVIAVQTIKQALEVAEEWFNLETTLTDPAHHECMVIGGAEIYELFLPLADQLYLTEVHAMPQGDAFFPKMKSEQWDRIVLSNEQLQRPTYHRCFYRRRPVKSIKPLNASWGEKKITFRAPRGTEKAEYQNF